MSLDVPKIEYTLLDVPKIEYTLLDVPKIEYTLLDVPFDGLNAVSICMLNLDYLTMC
jgi:hypothetical protein